MYISFNPIYPLINRILLGTIGYIAFLLALFITYRVYFKEFPKPLKLGLLFIPLFGVATFLNIESRVNALLCDKSFYVYIGELIYAITAIKIGFKIKLLDSGIICLSSVVINAIVFTLLVIIFAP